MDWGQFENRLGSKDPGYTREEERLGSLFRKALAQQFALPCDHPKFPRVWTLAYEYGHSGGVHEIAGWFGVFAGLVVDE